MLGILSRVVERVTYSFREILLYHHDSIEFRAKLYSLMIGSNSESRDCNLQTLETLGIEIYSDAPRRHRTLVLIVEEYVEKIKLPNGLGIDELIEDIERDLQRKNRFANKINIEKLREFQRCTPENSEEFHYQNRILDFLKKLKEQYTTIKKIGGDF